MFTVTGVEQHPKDDAPREQVHGATDGPELRLITCGGIFDRSIGHDDDNINVFAERRQHVAWKAPRVDRTSMLVPTDRELVRRSVSSLELPVADPRRHATVRDDAGDAAERDLLERIAGGDQGALGGLFDRVGARVYGVAQRVVRDPAQAEEVTQQVLLEVWTDVARFDAARGSARSWIVTMARRQAIDRVRSEQASCDRTRRIGIRDQQPAFDEVSERVLLGENTTRSVGPWMR